MSKDQSRSATILSSEPLYRGFVKLDLLRIAVSSPAGRAVIEREVHSHGHVAALLPVDPRRGRATLVRQFRTAPFLDGSEPWCLEMPAGILDDHSAQACAERETQEETGLEVRDVAGLGHVWTSPGAVLERVHLFWGLYDGPPAAETGGLDEESEMIEVVELPLANIREMCLDGRIEDAKTVVAVLRLMASRPDLFA
ncbi:NUDIX domain-containing protein [Lutibaculum baratangense]|uniref:GDP-mannose pyrophosphatase n=1 Tax=Lutibaculum baratangense AMV1 TaxID=631454 RepID=V4RI17_9HYPH|nr:NUDIX domain-containing protein [Lutibaculum baratangense]ESR22905.1 NTP pyrophosphohydrolase including oxidative damage repair enzyme [Lutibaculum baratangense AMV1]